MKRNSLKKYKEENAHIEFLRKKGLSNIEIADRLIHILITALEEGYRLQYPDMSIDELRLIIRHHINNLRKPREKKREKIYSRI